MSGHQLSPRQQALSSFLVNARARLSPAQVNLPDYGRRRTPGLRREEVAQLCGISVTWYTWIEQGRKVNVSDGVWERLAAALQLSPAEKRYLFKLAERPQPEAQHGSRAPLPAALQTAVQRIQDPSYVLDRQWNIICFNEALNELFEHWPASQKTPNLLDFIFLSPRAKHLVVDWEERARRSVAEFRADTVADYGERSYMERLAQLSAQSPDFERWWADQSVRAREGGLRRFRVQQGRCADYEQLTFRLAAHPDYKLVMLIAQPAD